MDIRELDARAVRTSVAVVAAVTPDDLGRPTPCAEWTLAELLAHMTVQHRGFAAAARGAGADPAVWQVRPDPDPVASYTDAADDVVAAFGSARDDFALAEFGATFPADQAIGFHFIDYVVHGWDVARALGLDYELDPDLAGPALEIARAVPDGEARLRPGAAFGPSLRTPPDAGAMAEILTRLGRSPHWSARDGQALA
jgi:uncharacterized protein (TIGR03086 family)